MTDVAENAVKPLQAWLDLKFKLGTLLLIGNGALIGTSVAFIKDMGPAAAETFPLWSGVVGLSTAGLALVIVADYADDRLELCIEGNAAEQTRDEIKRYFQTKSRPVLGFLLRPLLRAMNGIRFIIRFIITTRPAT